MIGGDRFGRRGTVMLGELIIIIGAILQASSFSLAQLIVARVISESLLPFRFLQSFSCTELVYNQLV